MVLSWAVPEKPVTTFSAGAATKPGLVVAELKAAAVPPIRPVARVSTMIVRRALRASERRGASGRGAARRAGGRGPERHGSAAAASKAPGCSRTPSVASSENPGC